MSLNPSIILQINGETWGDLAMVQISSKVGVKEKNERAPTFQKSVSEQAQAFSVKVQNFVSILSTIFGPINLYGTSWHFGEYYETMITHSRVTANTTHRLHASKFFLSNH